MHNLSFKPGQAQRGVAMVEFAITLPLLLLLLLAIAEFGRMLYQYNSLLQASRDASRYAAGEVWNSGGTEPGPGLITQIKNVAVYGVPDQSNPDVCPPPGSGDPDPCPPVVPGLTIGEVTVSEVGSEHIQVSISYEFNPVIGNGLPALIGDAIPLNFELVATTVMRVLR
jgi:hypothetical protein